MFNHKKRNKLKFYLKLETFVVVGWRIITANVAYVAPTHNKTRGMTMRGDPETNRRRRCLSFHKILLACKIVRDSIKQKR